MNLKSNLIRPPAGTFSAPAAGIHSVRFGMDCEVYAPVNLYGCEISKRCRIGAFVEIQEGVLIGELCKISSHSFICTGVIIYNRVFVGHGVKFCNTDVVPTTKDSKLLWNMPTELFQTTTVEDDVFIGTGAVILPGVTIRAGAVIGAGSVVTKDVEYDSVVVGNPARHIKWRRR